MIISLQHNEITYQADLSQPLDISIPLGNVKCFYAPDVEMTPYTNGDFIGAVKSGAPVNFFDVQLNPHGNGTHTECLGHLTEEQESVNQALKQFHFIAKLITVDLTATGNDDMVITLEEMEKKCPNDLSEALLIRTLPNSESKVSMDYSGTNPPYIEAEAMEFIVEKGVKHLLVDLPSVDREVDQGVLASHHVFWKVGSDFKKENARKDCTITEMIFVNDDIVDGLYLLNLQIAPLELDASPGKPVLYALTEMK